MGRPLRKDRNGVDVIKTFGTNTPGDGSAGIRVQAYNGGSLGTAYYILKQRGSKTFVVTTNGTDKFTCVLQSTTPNANGEMMMYGYTDPGDDASMVVIAKITKRVATDFSGKRYKWYLSQFADSSGDVIVLQAL